LELFGITLDMEQAEERAREAVRSFASADRLKELSDRTGIDYGRIRNISAGRVQKFKSGEVEKILVIVGKEVFTPVASKTVYIPIVGNAAAGDGALDHPDEYSVPVPMFMTTDQTVGWITEGTSMMPLLEPGDIVVAEPRKELKYGCLMLFRNDAGVLVKIPRYGPSGDYLESLNPAFEDIPALVEILGLVTGIYHSKGTRTKILFDSEGCRPNM
jgi:phage repressor protein C with HTH and peptisase S24 domain